MTKIGLLELRNNSGTRLHKIISPGELSVTYLLKLAGGVQ